MSTTPRSVPLVALAALLGGASAVAAQGDGSIRGTVLAAASAQPIANAQVFVVGTLRRAVTNDSGQYTITDVPAGTYQLRARLIGFAEGTRTVTVTAGQVATVEF